MSLTIGLKLRNKQGLKRFLKQVQNPSSSHYHRFLTPSEFTQRYGPTRKQVDAVKKFLQRNNLKVKSISANNLLIHVKGTTAAFERAFSIGINNYKLNGRTFLSTEDRPQIPRTLSGTVLNVLGLNRAQVMHPHSHFKPFSSPGRRTDVAGARPQVTPPPPPATASSQYFVPSQIATAYDWPSITEPENGAGVSVAIITADSSGLASSNAPSLFWAAYGLPDHTINVIPVDGDEGLTDGMGETLLDIEWSGAMAPGITQNVYVASNPTFMALADAFNQCVNDDTSQVMTTSWGLPESALGSLAQISDQIFMQGAAEGISMFAAAGDHGSSDGAYNQRNVADFPSSSPYITTANGSVLKIRDIEGHYATEFAWYMTGGAISQWFTQPPWQTGTGVPDNGMRMNSDMALNSGSQNSSFYIVYEPQLGIGGYAEVYGTSAVAPQLAALFAIGISQQGGVSLGQSNRLIYEDVNAGHYASDFRDITSGCNGVLPDGSQSCAATGWDHPTGWGSPKASSFLSHLGVTSPSGTLSGTVTNASGKPVAGAAISVDGSYQGLTENDGSYSFILPAGSHTVTAVAFGYKNGTASATVTADDTTTQNFTLDAAPTATVSGKVTDGSGHGYGLYAEITVKVASTPTGYGKPKNIQAADIWTDPKTGAYSVKLPQGYGYTMNVFSALDGYQTASKTMTLSANEHQNFPLDVTGTCSAPGYYFKLGGFGQDFNSPTFPPDGWSVTKLKPHSAIWELSSASGNFRNQTGGTGTAAEVNFSLGVNYNNTPPSSAYDTALITPPISATSLQGTPILRYLDGSSPLTGQPLDLDITTDDGSSWINILHWTSAHGGKIADNDEVDVNLLPYLPSSGHFQLRWHSYGPAAYGNPEIEIDDVAIGSCETVPGGLVMGQVTDAKTGKGIVGGSVADGNGVGSNTVANYADPNLPVGFYEFFDSAGHHTLTADAFRNYAPASAGITLKNDGVAVQNFALKSATFEADPGQIALHVTVNNSATASFALSNTGSAAARYRILGISGPAPAAQASTMAAPNAGTVSAWQEIPSYPAQYGVGDNMAARDPATGKLYSVGGFSTGVGPIPNAKGPPTNSAYVYDPSSEIWSAIASAPAARRAGAAAFMNGKLYIAGGWGGNDLRPVAETDIYDPKTGEWTTGRPDPVPEGGSAYAVLDGSLYMVGGCQAGGGFPACGAPTQTVEVYHPVSDSWSSAADYPTAIAFAACGAIDGKLYCAGGMRSRGAVSGGYVYDPVSNTWSPIASMFAPLGGSFYTAADGLLMVAGGISTDINLTSQAEAYNPQTDSWFPLPKLRYPVFRGGHACGLYEIGGAIGFNVQLGGMLATPYSAVLPGYTQQCGTTPSASWLSTAPAAGTLQAGATAKIVVYIDSSGQTADTTSQAYLKIANRSPYGPVTVPVTVHWEAQPVNLILTGDVAPQTAQKGGNLVYTLNVENKQTKGDGAATETMLTYQLPSGVRYISGNGEGVSCTAPSGSSSAAPSAATGAAGIVSCDLGTLAQGASKAVTIAVQVNQAGKLDSHFEVSSREPNDSDKSTLDIHATVIGIADVSASGSNATISEGTDGTIKLAIANSGPDSATDVQFKVSAGGNAKLTGATSSQGSCTASENGAFTCDIGELEAGGKAEVTLTVFGTSAGTATVQGQALTSSDDSDQSNNVATATVTVKAASNGGGGNNGGGGALGWVALAALLGLALAGAGVAKARKS